MTARGALAAQHLEELTLNAWPAPRRILFDGWLLNFAHGYTRRANSIWPLYPSSLPLGAKIEACEAIYAARGQPVLFKLSSQAMHAALDAELARRGYVAEGETSVQTAELGGRPADDGTDRPVDDAAVRPADEAAVRPAADEAAVRPAADEAAAQRLTDRATVRPAGETTAARPATALSPAPAATDRTAAPPAMDLAAVPVVTDLGAVTAATDLGAVPAVAGRGAVQPATDLAAVRPATDLRAVRLVTDLQDGWLDDFGRLSGTPAQARPAMVSLLQAIAPDHVFASLDLGHGQGVVGVGLATAERGHVGLFDIVVDGAVRNQGLGRRIVSALLDWGRGRGAERAYLAVVSDNRPARHLYARLGFAEVYTYWYRRRTAPDGA